MTEVKYDIGGGKEIIAEYDEYGIMEITRECFEALIEKQIPKKAVWGKTAKVRNRNTVTWVCPACRYHVNGEYCRKCGQRIDWGNDDDRAD